MPCALTIVIGKTGRFQQVLFNVMLFLMGIAVLLVSIILYVLLSDCTFHRIIVNIYILGTNVRANLVALNRC